MICIFTLVNKILFSNLKLNEESGNLSLSHLAMQWAFQIALSQVMELPSFPMNPSFISCFIPFLFKIQINIT